VGGGTPLAVGGWTVFLSDLNDDGYRDLMHVGLGINLQQSLQESQCLILSGRDGSTLRIDPVPSLDYVFGRATAAGDWDHDGLDDYAVARYSVRPPYGPNIVEVRSGANGNPLMQVSGEFGYQFGVYITSDLDVDGDGEVDLIVGASREPPPSGAARKGVVHVYGHSGHELYSLPIPHWGLGTFGGDLDGDGCDELIIGSADESNRGAALVYSGRTGTLLVAGVGEENDGIGSGHSAGCTDVDGDGVRDFVSTSTGGFFLRGVVRVFSGCTGRQIYAWDRGPASGYGEGLAISDLDRDGIDDLLVGVIPCPIWSGLEWNSLRDGSTVTAICNPETLTYASGFGVSVIPGPPWPGDAFPVFAVTEAGYGNFGHGPVGRLHLFRAAPQSVAELGPGCAGTLGSEPRLGFTAYPTFTRVHVSHVPMGSTAFLLLGANATTPPVSLHLGLEPFGLAGCELHVPVQVTAAVTTGGDGTRRGYASVDLPLPVAASQGAISLSGQWLVLGRGDRFPGALSRAISWSH
jgi:hypothetical protein